MVGYPRDGSIVNIDHDTVELAQRWKDRTSGSYHEVGQVESPTFIWRRWSKEGDPLEKHTFKVRGLPFARASYQSYSSLLELDNGDYLTALEWVDILPEDEWTTDSARPRPQHAHRRLHRSFERSGVQLGLRDQVRRRRGQPRLRPRRPRRR